MAFIGNAPSLSKRSVYVFVAPARRMATGAPRPLKPELMTSAAARVSIRFS